jgi:hypothetical protein
MADKGRNKDINDLAKLLENINQFFDKANYKKAASLCKKVIENSGHVAEKHVLAKVYFTWVLSQMRLNDYKPISKIIGKAKDHIGEYLDLTFMHVMTAYGSENWQKTIEWVDKYLAEHNQADPADQSYLKHEC